MDLCYAICAVPVHKLSHKEVVANELSNHKLALLKIHNDSGSKHCHFTLETYRYNTSLTVASVKTQ